MSCKIVFIGAGSVQFGSAIIGDLAYHAHDLANAEVVLVDIDPLALSRALAYARRLFAGLPLRVSATSDRRIALPGADFVIVSVAVNRIAEWKLDWSIPLKHGVRHVRGENGGPGALRHAMRSIPLVLAIARDIEELAPQALMLNYTNPLARVCLAVSRYTSVRCVGLSRRIELGFRSVNRVLRLVPEPKLVPEQTIERLATVSCSQYQLALGERFQLEAGGINGYSFFTQMTDRLSGEDLYPSFHQILMGMPDNWQLLSRRLYDAFGLYCACGDEYAGEFVGWAADVISLSGHDFAAHVSGEAARLESMKAVGNGTQSARKRFSGERALPLIAASVKNRLHVESSVNLPNGGKIANLPRDAIVEIPATVDGMGVNGLTIAPLPPALASTIGVQCDITSLAVDGIVNRHHKSLLQALLLDPTVRSYMQADHLLTNLLTPPTDRSALATYARQLLT